MLNRQAPRGGLGLEKYGVINSSDCVRDMNKLISIIIGYLVCATPNARSQGEFVFSNITAPTRIGSIDGPLAGPGIWAQMLAGTSEFSLQPVGIAIEHGVDGLVFGGGLVVPDAPCGSSAYVQMIAWDGALWGTSLSGVPSDQLGRTDVVLVGLYCFPRPIMAPSFTQPAIVPIPEPSVVALGLLSASVFLIGRCFRRVRPGVR